MNLRQVQTITVLILEFAVVTSVTYYCENGNTVTISNETNGNIRTVRSGTSNYDNNLNCGWVINGGSNKIIQITINGVNLQHAPSYTSCGGYDHLSIIDGNSGATTEITSICGERNPYEIISSGQYVYLKFYSNDKNFYSHSGVSLSFNVFDKNECPPGWNNMTTTDQCFRIRQSPSSGIDWFSAYHNCLYSQANLAIVDDHVVFDKLYDEAQSLSVSSAWIGLTDIETEGVFKWLNKKKLVSWIRVDGNIDDYDCGIFDFTNKRFGLRDCKNDKHLLVCQRNRVNKTEVYVLPEEEEITKEADKFNIRIILIIVGIVIAIVIVIIFIVCRLKRKKAYKRAHQSVEMDSVPETNTPSSSHCYTRTRQEEEDHPDKTPLPEGSVYPSAPPPYEYAISGNA